MTPDEAREIAIRENRAMLFIAKALAFYKLCKPQSAEEVEEAAAVLEAQANVEEKKAAEVEYAICQKRGHQAGPNAVSDNFYTWHFCKWCGAQYRIGGYETVVEASRESASKKEDAT